LLVCFVGLGSAHASSNWLTLVGDPADPASDYIQFDPSALARDGEIPTIPVRVSRTSPRTSKEGIVFRSFESVVAVDCKRRTARFLRASFYAEPDFKGTPLRTEVFGPLDIRPMEFKLIKGAPTRRVIDAACNTTAIKSI
jgi:hypothetical protein